MKSLTAILKPTELKEDVENTCDDAFACLDEIVTMCNNLVEGLQDVDDEMDESMMNCISSSREHIKSACECALEAYGFDACCDTCDDDEEEEAVKEAKMKDILPTGEDKSYLEQFMKKLNALRKEFPRVIIRGHYDKTVEAGLLDKETGNVIRIGKDIDFSINESEKDMGISKDDETEFHKKLDDLVHNTFGKRMDEAAGSHSMGTATVTFIGSRLNGKKVDIFHKFPDGRINVQYKKSDKKGDVINLTLRKGQYELDEAEESKQKTHLIGLYVGKILDPKNAISRDTNIMKLYALVKNTPFGKEFENLRNLPAGDEFDEKVNKWIEAVQDYYVDMSEAVSQKVKIGSKVKGIMGVYGRSSGTVVKFGYEGGKKIVYVKSPDGKEWNTTEYNIRVVDKLDEAKKVDEPEEAGLKDYVMPKSVTKMLAKQQFNRVKAGTKLFDAVSKVDKAKDLLHLYTSKKHKNILIGMFMIGKKASFFIHDTEAKSQRLDNVGRYKDLKGFVAALTAKFEGGEKNESAKKPLTKILGEAEETPHAYELLKLLKQHEFVTVPKDHPFFKKHDKDGKLLGLYAIPMRAGKYADTVIGVTSELDGDGYFVADTKQHKTFANVKDVNNAIKKMVEGNSSSVKNEALHPDLVNAGFKSVKDVNFDKHWNPTDRKVVSMYVHPESKTLLAQTDYQKAPYSVVIKGNAKEYIKKSVADYTAYKAAGGLKESIELKKK